MTAVHQRLCSWLRDPMPPGRPDDEVVELARSEGVHLLLADRCSLPGLMPEVSAAAVLDELQARELDGVLSALSAEGIQPVLLKGAGLARTLYARPELRPRSDTDFMIAEDARHRAARVLERLGYERATEVDGELAVGQFHFLKTDGHGVPHALDVHWRLSNVRLFCDSLSYDELRREAVPVPGLGPYARAASPVHALLISCIHRIAHHADTGNLLWLFDAHLLERSLTRREGEVFVALATERRMRSVCARTLSLSQEAFGVLGRDVGEWISALSAPDGVDEPSRAFIGGTMRPAGILLSDITATRGWTARLRLLREHVFPQVSYIRARYPGWPVALLPLAYVHRVVRGAPRWFRR